MRKVHDAYLSSFINAMNGVIESHDRLSVIGFIIHVRSLVSLIQYTRKPDALYNRKFMWVMVNLKKKTEFNKNLHSKTNMQIFYKLQIFYIFLFSIKE